MKATEWCCCCRKEMEDASEHCYVTFRYQVPCIGSPERVLVAVVCQKCEEESKDPSLYPVVESLINANIIRIENPDMIFTPGK